MSGAENPSPRPVARQLGHVGPYISELCVGTSPLGGMPALYGYNVEAETAIATVEFALEEPSITFLDTSNNYGGGESERRIGEAIRRLGGLPDGFVVATKADPAPGDREFSGSRVLESFAESLDRLGLERVPVFYLHDPEAFEFDDLIAPGGAVDAMKELKRRGLVDVIGVAGGDLDAMRRYVDTGAFDILLNHNQYTLLDRSADDLIDHAVGAGLSYVNAAPYASGLLAKPVEDRPRYQYREPSADILARTQRLRDVCDRFGVPLAAAALQFSTRDPRVSSTVVGVSSPARVEELLRNSAAHIPLELWFELEEVR
ncbi:D-threo-aldose 1-dehydrogenase [Microbacterium sp. cf046]|uniref:aldo/keto reductase n=1 Tax=Microbacterium sp. cf046 TaxID=1761803 RepID=UPI0008EA22C7|nr:aldo/keto reductase [Microbacterium sp. cf046]SFR91558.1 D-threo-aldose 1-dehydrogenase [Microbacterium sp. cf046]